MNQMSFQRCSETSTFRRSILVFFFLRVQNCSKAAQIDSSRSMQESRKDRTRIDLTALPTVSSILGLFPSLGGADVPA